jgi:dCTP deaminase
VRAEDGRIILDPGAFYILQSRESSPSRPDHAAEMAPYLAMVGEFRVHYAGFFDPGFGWGAPSRGVLEVRCHEAPFALEHGQVVGRLVFERMLEAPVAAYGAGIASNYQGQGLKLSKHFRAALEEPRELRVEGGRVQGLGRATQQEGPVGAAAGRGG